MFWFVIALQALAPFIHAHAGTVHLGHSGLLHLYQSAHGDAACQATASDEHDAEVEVAQGMRMRHAAPAVTEAQPVAAARPQLAALADRPAAGVLAASPLRLSPPDHALPHALGPPLR